MGTQKDVENSPNLAIENNLLIHLLSSIILVSSKSLHLRADLVPAKPKHVRAMSRQHFAFSFPGSLFD